VKESFQSEKMFSNELHFHRRKHCVGYFCLETVETLENNKTKKFLSSITTSSVFQGLLQSKLPIELFTLHSLSLLRRTKKIEKEKKEKRKKWVLLCSLTHQMPDAITIFYQKCYQKVHKFYKVNNLHKYFMTNQNHCLEMCTL
jgi:hypothetical protein